MSAHGGQHFPCPSVLHRVTARSSPLLHPPRAIGLGLASLCIGKLSCAASIIGIVSSIQNRLLFYTLFFPGGTFSLRIYFQCLLLMSQFHQKNPDSSQPALRPRSCVSRGISASQWISTATCREVPRAGQHARRPALSFWVCHLFHV